MSNSTSVFADRLDRVRATMASSGTDVLLLSVGADLPWLTGYEAMPLERLTMLVVPRDGEAHLVIPGLEAPRVDAQPDIYNLVPWAETEDPVAIVAGLAGAASTAAIGNTTWSQFTLGLQALMPSTAFSNASDVVGPLRNIKTADEVEALRNAAHAADRVIGRLQSGEISVIGRTEADVSAEIRRQLVDEGHYKPNFAIVASGPNAASPHHEAEGTVITEGQGVLFDIGGTMHGAGAGYCSDITRCIYLGEPPAEFVELYDVLHTAQQAQVQAATVGTTCEDVDRVGRKIIADAGYGDYFIHRTGHGIGVEAHEHPYIVEGNRAPLEAGNAFSIEPGIYIPGKWGARLEDIVVAADDGPDVLATSDHALAVVG